MILRRGTFALRSVMVFSLGAFSALGAVPAQPDRAALDEGIKRNRMGTVIVQAAPNAAVKVEQVRHAFWFGAALANQAFDGGMSPENTAKYRQVFFRTSWISIGSVLPIRM